MAKGWKTIQNINITSSITTEDARMKRNQNFKNAIHNVKSYTAEELKKYSDALYDKKQADDERLLNAFEGKRLKSKEAIKKAIALKKEKDAEAAKKQKKQKTATLVPAQE